MTRRRSDQQAALFDEPSAHDAITDIQVVKRDPNRRNVKVAGRGVANLRASDAEELKLVVGMRWTAALAKRVAEAQEADKARRDAMRLLSARPRSRKDLIDRLAKRGHSDVTAKRVADEAERDGWLDEKAFADDVVRGVTSRRPAGRRLVEEKLRHRGVDESTARRVADEAAARQDDRAAAMTLARRRLGTMRTVEPTTALRRIAGVLARRGFDEDTVDATIDGLRLILKTPDQFE